MVVNKRIAFLAMAAMAVPAAVGAAAQTAEVVRQIDDPAARGTWLLVRDPIHRAGPGRFIWVPRAAASDPPARMQSKEALRPIILAGDRVVVEEETSVVDARLAATALNPAPAGAPLRVCLEIGGRVVRAIAIAPGRAQLAPNPDIALEAAEP